MIKKTKIYTITHKSYWIPKDELYFPLQVGFGDDLGFLRDNTGDNISGNNSNYCELTGLYWLWKNIKGYDYVGIDHYRRHFCLKKNIDKKQCILKYDEIQNMLNENTIILPKKRHYYIETVYSQYAHAHHKMDLDTTRKIIERYYPEYLRSFDEQMNKKSLHLFNMFIMPADVFDEYCKWLFGILFKLEDNLDISDYTNYDKRVFGFVGERLLDVFVAKNKYNIIELPYVFMEKQNWVKKVYEFLKRKMINSCERNG